ncbi:MAG TPA: hypothetical protein VN631_06570 [Negativicutes bacterium]|nr:hypothetical protein [Negativicutes bacterium]
MKKMLCVEWKTVVSFVLGSICFFSSIVGECAMVNLADSAPTVELVQVEVITDATSSSRVLRRMSESVKTIGEHLLLGRKTIEVSQQREHYEKLVRDVFDRVLVGYTVESVVIEPSTTARILVRITPWGDTVRDVDIQVDYSGVAIESIPLVKTDMGKMEEEIKDALLGLPVDAVDWASGVARELIRDILRRRLPEFHFSLDVEAGRRTNVRLSLFPTGQLVKEARVFLRSNTIPNLLLVHARPAVELQAQSLRGLPVEYVERHLKYFTEKVRQATLADPVIRQLDLKVLPVVRPGVDSEVAVSVEAETYRITAEVFLDIGRDKENISGKAHVGRLIGSNDELFLEVKVLPGTMTWQVMPGWGHQFGSDTWAGARYRTNDREFGLWLNQGLGGRWSLRAERWPGIDRNEVGIRYKLHDFLSAEFVLTNDSNWLRLVGHL